VGGSPLRRQRVYQYFDSGTRGAPGRNIGVPLMSAFVAFTISTLYVT
jgi:hypothetical protein